jgi:hypothetical protein
LASYTGARGVRAACADAAALVIGGSRPFPLTTDPEATDRKLADQ